MITTYSIPASKVRKLFLGLAGISLCLGLGLTACEMGGFSDAATNPTDTTKVTGFATLRITNKVSQDPRPLTFFLYSATAVDFSNAVNATKLGEVFTDSTKSFQVPAGTWKLASQDRSSTLEPMQDEGSGGQEWLKSVFAKDGNYSLILTSNAGNLVWTPSYTTIPAITSN